MTKSGNPPSPRLRRTSRQSARKAKPRAPAQTLFKLGREADASHSIEQRRTYESARKQRYRDLFNTLLGREVLADILASVGFFAADAPHDRDIANYRNGMRAGAAEILKAMGVDDSDALTRAMINDDLTEVFDEET